MTPEELADLRRQCEADPNEWWPPMVVLDLIDEIERLRARLGAGQTPRASVEVTTFGDAEPVYLSSSEPPTPPQG